MDKLKREMHFEEEYSFLQKEVKELFDKEDEESEPPESHSVVRRALRCIKKLVAEVEPYKAYKDLDEQGLLLRLPCKVGDTVYIISDGEIVLKKADMSFLGILWEYYRKEWFITREEAEQKLKEMESD